ncbi:MAG: hypothetical protein AABY18_03220 [Candidatus Thermoplasmatota archaeon]
MPFMARLRRAGHDEAGFHAPKVGTWFRIGVAAIAVLAVLPFVTPQWSGTTERLATLSSLVFLIAAVGLWLGLGGRAFLVATAMVALLYAATAWTTFAFPLADFFVVALVASFSVFALAGFNLVFVLEEIVYDVHVLLHVRHRVWEVAPTLLVLAVAVGLPLWEAAGGPEMPALWTASIAASLALLAWWFVAVVNGIEGRMVLRELHLLVVGALLASAAADAIVLLQRLPLLIPSLIAYLVLIGTWVYVTYTTLQRTHFLLRGDDAAPWVAILLGASLAILAHAQVLFRSQGTQALTDLADTRLHYLSIGLWIGIAFYVLRSLARILGYLRDTRGLGVRGRQVAGTAARVAGSLEGTARGVHDAADVVLRGIDHVLPGQSAPPKRPAGWELDEDRLRRL